MNKDSRLIDWEEGKFRLGDEGMLRTFLQKFQQDALYNSISAIIKHAKAQEWDLVRREAHSLRGSCGYVSANTCQKLSIELQKAIQQKNIDFKILGKALNNLIDHSKELQEYLSKEFGKPFLDPDQIFTCHLEIEDFKTSHSGFIVKSVPYQKVTESKPQEKMTSNTYIEGISPIKQENEPIEEPEQEMNSTDRTIEVPVMKTSMHQHFDHNYIKENDIEAYNELGKHWRCTFI